MLARYKILVKRDNRFYILKRKLFWWKELPGSYALIHFAENEVVQKLRNDEKEKNTKLTYES